MIRMSVPPSSRWVAKLCRSVCTVTCLARPAAARADRQVACSTWTSIGLVHRDRDLVAGVEPDGLRAAVLLWRHARAWRDPGAHSLRPAAAQAAGGAQRRRGRPLSRSRSEPEDPRRADRRRSLSSGRPKAGPVGRGVARLRGGRAQARRCRQRPDGDPCRARQGRQEPALAKAGDRYVMLSAQLLGILRTYWRLARPQHWLFPGRAETKPIDVQVLHAACRSARAAAGL